MRKVLLSLLVLALAAPAMAVVEFAVVDNADGTATITMNTNGAVLRGVALTVTGTNGAKLVDLTATGIPAEFNTFIDYAYTVEAGTPGSYEIGNGHPFAAVDAAGVAVADAQTFAVCMGVLDEAGAQAGYSNAAATNLVTINTGAGNVCLSLNSLRGGVVGDAAITTNLDSASICQDITLGQEICNGDLNADGVKNLDDVMLLIQECELNDFDDLACTETPCNGDLNADGVKNLDDVMLLIQECELNDFDDLVC